jgi:lysozyme family protein
MKFDPQAPQNRQEYQTLFDSCEIRPDKKALVEAIVQKIVANKGRYEEVEKVTRVPWYIVGVIHSLEADLNFSKHLHNGDPLSHRTKNVPAGRPVAGSPPFTWEESAVDALQFDHLTSHQDWTLPGSLGALERYNGIGYRKLNIPSPYLWSFSNHYVRGKFVADGQFDRNAVSGQCGAAVLLKAMVLDGRIAFPGSLAERAPLGVSVTATNPAAPVYPGHVVTEKETDKDLVKTLQNRLNEVGCGPIDVDGIFGKKTKDAVMQFQTRHTDDSGRPLDADGKVGPLTWAALFRASTAPSPHLIEV